MCEGPAADTGARASIHFQLSPTHLLPGGDSVRGGQGSQGPRRCPPRPLFPVIQAKPKRISRVGPRGKAQSQPTSALPGDSRRERRPIASQYLGQNTFFHPNPSLFDYPPSPAPGPSHPGPPTLSAAPLPRGPFSHPTWVMTRHHG